MRSFRLPLYSQAKKPRFQTSAKPSPPCSFSAPFSKAYQVPSGSASVGAGSPRTRHRSMKWDCAAARSEVEMPRHLAANSPGVRAPMIRGGGGGGSGRGRTRAEAGRGAGGRRRRAGGVGGARFAGQFAVSRDPIPAHPIGWVPGERGNAANPRVGRVSEREVPPDYRASRYWGPTDQDGSPPVM